MTYNGQYYFLSNAHVLADGNFGKTFFLIGGGKTMNIGGQYYNTSMPLTGYRKDDTIEHLSKKKKPIKSGIFCGSTRDRTKDPLLVRQMRWFRLCRF